MEYNTRYNIGDKVWIMYSNKPIMCDICGITLVNYVSQIDWKCKFVERYKLNNDLFIDDIFYDCDDIFSSKDELIKSL